MFYRPRFCSSCGEKIARAEWRLWTSRRFCDVCVTEHPVAEYAPKAVVVGAIVAIFAGLTAFFGSGGVRTDHTVSNNRLEKPTIAASLASKPVPVETPATEVASAKTVAAEPPITKQQIVATVDQTAICGAMTKKGSACSRRVKGNVRCFQHQGMPTAAEFAKQ